MENQLSNGSLELFEGFPGTLEHQIHAFAKNLLKSNLRLAKDQERACFHAESCIKRE